MRFQMFRAVVQLGRLGRQRRLRFSRVRELKRQRVDERRMAMEALALQAQVLRMGYEE